MMRRRSGLAIVVGCAAVLGLPVGAAAGVDPATGTFGTSVSITVPPYHGLEPKLALGYSSAGGNGAAGVGWALSGFSVIERASPGRGAPRYDATDIYLLNGQELVACGTCYDTCYDGCGYPYNCNPHTCVGAASCAAGGTHTTKVESYLRIQQDVPAAGQWTVTNRDGAKVTYAPVHTITSGTFMWGQSQARDLRGNVVTYTWQAGTANGYAYPDNVTYNGNTVKLYWEARTDIETSATGGGAMATEAKRLKSVDVKVGSSRVRAYKLTYTASATTARSLLASVQQYARNASVDAAGTVTGSTYLPAMTFGWSEPAAAPLADTKVGTRLYGIDGTANEKWAQVDLDGNGQVDYLYQRSGSNQMRALLWTGSALGADTLWGTKLYAVGGSEGQQRRYADVNGDGKADFVYFRTATTQVRVMLSTGATAAADTAWGTLLYNVAGLHNEKWRLVDVNGDGLADLVYQRNATGEMRVMLSTGNGFLPDTVWGTKLYDAGATEYDRWDFVDVNGDGKADYVYHRNNTAELRVLLSTGTAFAADTLWGTKLYDIGQTDHWRFIDLNGDGKADFYYQDYNTSDLRVLLSTGSGFLADTLWGTKLYPINGTYNAQWDLVDLNRDGLLDFVYQRQDTTELRALYGTGTAFAADVLWASKLYAVGGTDGLNRGFADANGDGRPDFLYNQSGTYTIRCLGSQGAPTVLLSSIGNGFGGTTSITYTPSSSWDNANNPPITATVATVAVTDGRSGVTATTGYEYGSGTYDYAEREFRGFATVTERLPCLAGECSPVGGPYGPYTTALLVLGPAGARPYDTYHYDASGGLLKSTQSIFAEDETNVPYYAREIASWETESVTPCPGPGCKRTYQERAYDGYGNVTQAVSYGNYDVTGDESTTVTTFRPNTSLWIVDKPAAVQVFQGVGTAGALLTDALIVYDANTTWDAAPTQGYLTQQQRWVDTTSSYVTKTLAYDSYGNVTKRTNELGAADTVVYDTTYHLYPTAVTNALGQTGTSTFDYVCGVELTATSANALTLTRQYDNLCRLTRSDGPLGGYETKAYVNFGSASAQYIETRQPGADGVEQWARKYFDGAGRTYKTEARGPSTIITQTEYNARGQVDKTSLPYYAGATVKWTTSAYDAQDRVTRVTAPDGQFQTTSYGLWQVTQVDVLGHTQEQYYDAAHRVTLTRELEGATWRELRQAYSASGELAAVTDPGGSVRSYTYNSLGWKLAMTDPNAGTWSYGYDATGRLTSQTDAKDQTTTYAYDVLGRRTQKVVKQANGTTERTVTWTFDEVRTGYYNKGIQTSMTDPSGTVTYDYDAAGRLVKTSRTVDGTAYTVARDFDAAGRVVSTTFPDGDQVTGVLYDEAGRVKTIPGIVTTATYSAAGALLTQTNANGTVTTHTYDANRAWLTALKTLKGTTTIQDLAYTRNYEGQVTAVTSPFAGEGWTYGYDPLHRLTAATNTSNSADSQTFAYAANNNVTTNSRLGTYSYPAATAARPHAVTAAGANSYSYDANGNLVAGAGRTLTWTPENLPATIGTATLTYDGNGMRLKKVVGSTTTVYLGDDYEVTGATATKYVTFAGRPVAKVVGTTKYWLHTDDKGSVQAVTDASGLEVQRLKYRPYGDRLATGTSHVEARSYIGQRQDESGLIYLHARYYDPALGRFISPDPVLDTRSVGGPNGYAYCGNDPVNRLDVDGQRWHFKRFLKKMKLSERRLTQGLLRSSYEANRGFWQGNRDFFVHQNRSAFKGGLFTAEGRDEATEGCYEMALGLNATPWVGGIAALPFIANGAALQGDGMTALRATATFIIAVVAIFIAVVLGITGYGGAVGGVLLSFVVGFVAGFLIGVINGANSGQAFYSGMAFGTFCASVTSVVSGVGEWTNGYFGLSGEMRAFYHMGASSHVFQAGLVESAAIGTQVTWWVTSTARAYSGPKQYRFDHRFDYVGHSGFGGNTMGGPLNGNTPWNMTTYLHDMAGLKEGYTDVGGHTLLPMPFSADPAVYYRSFSGDSYM